MPPGLRCTTRHPSLRLTVPSQYMPLYNKHLKEAKSRRYRWRWVGSCLAVKNNESALDTLLAALLCGAQSTPNQVQRFLVRYMIIVLPDDGLSSCFGGNVPMRPRRRRADGTPHTHGNDYQ
ncbi:hypothetical protein DOTSEDRAFT_67651 [Dothistroma septosporum NZE10]|uniref:Uncharacterized protein n=1 Tax=Dothistroma septosporum (strain NZE10 / CBS 128990) TaxID=675120 RepID=N1PYU4_DOTSN|nr:hypothetical protein DOTSEDRAFT_67651 [Dothistroma septosporum NZE10]